MKHLLCYHENCYEQITHKDYNIQFHLHLRIHKTIANVFSSNMFIFIFKSTIAAPAASPIVLLQKKMDISNEEHTFYILMVHKVNVKFLARTK